MDRRTFLQTSAAGGALISIGVGPAGCGNDVEPAPLAKVVTNATQNVPPAINQATLFDSALLDSATYGTVQLLVEFYPQLVPVGGAITLELGKEITGTDDARLQRADRQHHPRRPPERRSVGRQLSGAAVELPARGLSARLQPEGQAGRVPLPFVALLRRSGRPAVRRQSRVQAGQRRLQRWKVAAQTTAAGTLLIIDLKTTLPCDARPCRPWSRAPTARPRADAAGRRLPAARDAGRVGLRPADGAVEPDHRHAPRRRHRHRRRFQVHAPRLHRRVGRGQPEFECPCHGSTFASDGRATLGPATSPLIELQRRRHGHSVVVTIPVE